MIPWLSRREGLRQRSNYNRQSFLSLQGNFNKGWQIITMRRRQTGAFHWIFFASYALPESEMSSKDSDFLGTSIIFKNIYPLKLIYELSDRLNLSSIPFYKNIFIQIFNISLKR